MKIFTIDEVKPYVKSMSTTEQAFYEEVFELDNPVSFIENGKQYDVIVKLRRFKNDDIYGLYFNIDGDVVNVYLALNIKNHSELKSSEVIGSYKLTEGFESICANSMLYADKCDVCGNTDINLKNAKITEDGKRMCSSCYSKWKKEQKKLQAEAQTNVDTSKEE